MRPGTPDGSSSSRRAALGLPLRLVGRRREELEQLASDGEEIRVADARHEAELIEAFDGAFAVASTAGPFLDVGTKPVGAAIAVGAHYIDTARSRRSRESCTTASASRQTSATSSC